MMDKRKEIKEHLADEILFGKLKKGGSVNIEVKNNKLLFYFDGILKGE